MVYFAFFLYNINILKIIKKDNFMKICGLITEYNPFHKGHKIHIDTARNLSGADYLICIMSGSFVQRGEIAVFDKYDRAKKAVLSGVDLVIELPTVFATANAGTFAYGAVRILDSLNVVESICFGSRLKNTDILYEISQIIKDEDCIYKSKLKEGLKTGISYPKARENAVIHSFNYKKMEFDKSILSDANTNLGIEYITALKILNSKITPYTYERKEGFNASDIRKNLISDNKSETLKNNDLSEILQYRLLCDFDNIYDINEFLYNRIKNNLNSFCKIESFVDILKTKSITRSHIKRALLHILLNIKDDDMKDFINLKPDYIKVLCSNKKGKEILSKISKNSDINIIAKLSAAKKITTPISKKMLNIDIRAGQIYNFLIASKYGYKKNEYTDYRIFL